MSGKAKEEWNLREVIPEVLPALGFDRFHMWRVSDPPTVYVREETRYSRVCIWF